jgi:hypothetical protein
MSSIKIEVAGKGSVEFGVTSLPNRKCKALYTTRGAMLEPLAYFKSDECAEQFEKVLDFIVDNLNGSYNR